MAPSLGEKIIIDSHTGREKWTHEEIQRLGINILAIARTMASGSLMPLQYYPESNNLLVLTRNSSGYAICMAHPLHLKEKELYASFVLV